MLQTILSWSFTHQSTGSINLSVREFDFPSKEVAHLNYGPKTQKSSGNIPRSVHTYLVVFYLPQFIVINQYIKILIHLQNLWDYHVCFYATRFLIVWLFIFARAMSNRLEATLWFPARSAHPLHWHNLSFSLSQSNYGLATALQIVSFADGNCWPSLVC